MISTMDAKSEDEATESTADRESAEFAHLEDLSDGAGCAEIWEHLSDNRDENE